MPANKIPRKGWQETRRPGTWSSRGREVVTDASVREDLCSLMALMGPGNKVQSLGQAFVRIGPHLYA
jgi:hypothetical protein